MPLITLMNAHAAWGDLPLLDDADLSIEPGERVGLIGRNGTGKSTLLSILAGHTHLDDGELRVQDGLRVLYVEQEPVLPEAANVKESLILRGKLDKIEDEREHWRRLAKLDECLMKFELDPERSVARVSGGERKRAALALAFALEPDLLLLDEPTNHLDIVAITTLENLVAECGDLFILLSLKHISCFIVNSFRNEVPLSVCKFTFFYHYHQMFFHKTEQMRPIFPRLFPQPLWFFPKWNGKGVRQTGKLGKRLSY